MCSGWLAISLCDEMHCCCHTPVNNRITVLSEWHDRLSPPHNYASLSIGEYTTESSTYQTVTDQDHTYRAGASGQAGQAI